MARRKTEVFSMSFLDCITCAFGSVVLVYTLINAQGGLRAQTVDQTQRAEVSKMEEQVLEGYQKLVVLRNSLIETDKESVRTEGMGTRVLEETERLKVELADSSKETLSRREAIERLKADLKSLEEGNRRLEGASKDPSATGTRVRGFVGQGDRQYLTGLKVGGDRILMFVDVSASMLDETVVNVLRMRNMPESKKLMSQKWRRTVSTVEWLAAQMPLEGQFQIYAFNTKTYALVEGSEGKWLKANDPNSMTEALEKLRKTVPADGTSIENAFLAMNALNPKPDNVIMVTDGLPTQAAAAPLIRKTIDGDARLKLFERAFAKYPRDVPFNVILMPMEGDPMAPAAFWLAARDTGGSFMSPSKDWP
ncbi:vWA domain-containing protein [Peristeroidobacter agariperforans]|uniref:VWA domain-containing protein n=1 Tax=Peristeroidobacter agariperforans TaxID=268404 RepID=UPI00101D211D|nr:VWA domain-containing protein [Peristeroidobacter agariperforans]